MPRPRARSTLFPYTTLFRSQVHAGVRQRRPRGVLSAARPLVGAWRLARAVVHVLHGALVCAFVFPFLDRSEEHTSELQSRRELVCRLLLEKKKMTLPANPPP